VIGVIKRVYRWWYLRRMRRFIEKWQDED